MALSTFLPSKLRVLSYRLLGFKIGKKVTISPFSILIAEQITIDDYSQIKPFVLINVGNLEMGKYAVIASLSAVFGDTGLIMADRSRVGHANLLDCSDEIYLGHYCGLGPQNTIYTHASWLPLTKGFPNLRKPVRIGNYVWTGIRVTVFPGTIVEDYVFTHANMVLSGALTGNSFHTPDNILPLEKIQKTISINDVINRVIDSISKTISVYSDNNIIKSTTFSRSGIVIITSFNEELIEKASKQKVLIIAFMEKIDIGLRRKLEKLNIAWYDFSKIEMSSLSHRYKELILTQLVTWGGLRFLEK